MSILLNDNLKLSAGKPLNSVYFSTGNTPYIDVNQVNAAIPISHRYIGLTVNIGNVEYWYQNGTSNLDLVLKNAGGGTTYTSINGITLTANRFSLGGSLTGSTVLTDNRVSKSGLEYGGDYSTGFTKFSLVNKGYVTGFTSSLLTTANNGLTKSGANIHLGGALTGNTTIDSTTGFTLTLNTQTQGTPIITGKIGATTNVGLLSFKNQNGNALSLGLTDVFIGGGNGSGSNGAGNIALGSYNLRSIIAGATEFNGGRNIAIGWDNQTGMTTATHNIAIGRKLGAVKTGNYNYSIDIGYETNFNSVATSSFNDSHIAIGNYVMKNFTGLTNTSYVTAIGGNALFSAIARDGQSTIAIGPSALAFADFERYQIAIGDSAGRRSKIGRNNIMIGPLAGADMTGGSSGDTGVGNTLHNIAIGAHALQYANLVTKTTFVGTEAGSTSVTGLGHSGFGNWSLPRTQGSYNTGLGAFAGYHASLTLTGSTNTFIGYKASYGLESMNNSIVIGTNFNPTGSSKIYLGNSGQTVVLGHVSSGTTTNILVKETSGEIKYRDISNIIIPTNGLSLTGNKIGFGGILTGTTQLIDNRTTKRGIEYAADYSTGYTVLSLVHKGYVDSLSALYVSITYDVNANSQTATSPATGHIKYNNVVLTASTAIYIHDVNNLGVDMSNYFAQIQVGTILLIHKADNTGIYQRWVITSKTDNIGWWTLSVAILDFIGTIVNNNSVSVEFGSVSTNVLSITGGTNGISIDGAKKLKLGGNLTGATTIGLGANNLTFTGTTGTVKYGSDLSSQYTIRSLVDKGYVTGQTSTKLATASFNTYSGNTQNQINAKLATSAFNTYSGATATNIGNRLLTTSFNTYSGATATNIGNRLLTSSFNTYSGATATLIGTKVATANNGVFKSGTNVRLGGQLTGTTQIGLGTNSLTFSATTGTLKYVADYSANYTLRSLVDKGFVTGITTVIQNNYVTGATSLGNNSIVGAKSGKNLQFKGLAAGTNITLTPSSTGITISSSGGGGTVTGATNGLTLTGTKIGLGGTLTGTTQFIDNRATKRGIEYAGNYGTGFTKLSLVTKQFVTGITSTLLLTSAFNTYSGNTQNQINAKLATSAFNTYSGATATNIGNRLLTSAFNTYSGNTQTQINSKVAGATNGLTKTGTNVGLGGSLTGVTTIVDNRVTKSGIEYGGNYGTGFTKLSLVTKQFVTGITSTHLAITAFNTYSGNTQNQINTKLATSSFNTYSGNTQNQINAKLATSAFNTYSGNTQNQINAKVAGATNGLTKTGTNVGLGGSLTGTTTIVDNRVTKSGIEYGGNYGTGFTKLSLVTKQFVTGITSTLLVTSAFNTYSGNTQNQINAKLSTSAFNTYSGNTQTQINAKVAGATNGLTKTGTNVGLGGSLTGVTTIVDNRVTKRGIEYGGDYGTGFTKLSLVTKQFVTGITSVVLNNYVTGATSLGGTQTLVGTKSGLNLRFKGLTAGANITLTPTGNDITIAASAGGSGTTYSATNGLTLSGTKFGLGGTLTGTTQLVDNRVTKSGIEYGGNYGTGFTKLSLITKQFVTGITSTLLLTSVFNTYSGNTQNQINAKLATSTFNTYSGNTQNQINAKLATSAFNTYSGNTQNQINAKLATSAFNTYSGNTQTQINAKVAGATNGLTKTGTNVGLGGSLTGTTTIVDNRVTKSGIEYGGNYGTGFTKLSLVTKQFVTGITSTLLVTSAFNTYSGNTQNQINAKLATSTFNTYSGNTQNQINAKLATSAFNTYSGNTQTQINAKVAGATNGLTKTGTNVGLGGSLTGVTTIVDNRVTKRGIEYGGNYGTGFTKLSLVTKQFVTGITSTLLVTSAFNTYSGNTQNQINAKLATSAFNTYSGNTQNQINAKLATSAFNTYSGNTQTQINAKVAGATNGLTKTGSNVGLGGSLTGVTTIVDNRVTKRGIEYGGDYGTGFTKLSLVTKQFVTGITSTLLVTSAFNTYSGNTQNQINAKVAGATNGLTKTGTNVGLGGTLTGTTQFIDNRATKKGLEYAANYGTGFTARSLVDAGYVTGLTQSIGGTIQSSWNFSTTTTASDPGSKNFRLNNSTLASVTAIYFNNTTNQKSDASNVISYLVSGNKIYIQQRNDSTRSALFQVTGVPTNNTGWWTVPVSVVNSNTIYQNGADTGVALFFTAAGGSGTLTGATNGLSLAGGGTKVKLGGTLTGSTQIVLGTNNLDLSGTTRFNTTGVTSIVKLTTTTTATKAAIKIGSFGSDPSAPVAGDIYYNSGTNLVKFYNGTTWENIGSSSTGGTTYSATNGLSLTGANKFGLGGTLTGTTQLIDNRVTKSGIEYAGDYGTGFTKLSLVTKQYVTGQTSTVYTLNTVEVNIATLPKSSGKFSITGLTGLITNKPVYIQQANGPYTNKGTRDDESEMENISVSGKVLNATTIQCYWRSSTRAKGNYKFNYKVGS